MLQKKRISVHSLAIITDNEKAMQGTIIKEGIKPHQQQIAKEDFLL